MFPPLSQISKIHSNPFELKNPKFKNPFDRNPACFLHSVNDRGFLAATRSLACSLLSVNDRGFLAANRSPACSLLSVNDRGFLAADRSPTCCLFSINDRGFQWYLLELLTESHKLSPFMLVSHIPIDC
ncbi:hypothetical protein SLEP1_g26502 [Rubroshorea leprosula]|uniref:Uncharacterized protein n=1 Tax=Rubroshorea leprosula TaxID=152421 RepID=A0AAV5JXY4_9ROSI|nr:hypothetical protein SLEP1_g26502 [Rubroshorea leprosula]